MYLQKTPTALNFSIKFHLKKLNGFYKPTTRKSSLGMEWTHPFAVAARAMMSRHS